MYFWLSMLGIAVGMVLLLFLWLAVIQLILQREEKNPAFAAKMNKFRSVVEKIPTDKIKQWIGIGVAVSFLLYAYFFSDNG